MFNELKYKFQTKNYFNPKSEKIVSKIDIEKILKGEIINPNKLKNINSTTQNSFFIVNLKKEYQDKKQLKAYNITKYCNWIGHFNRQGSNQIAILENDGQYLLRSFHPKGIGFESKISQIWIDATHFDIQKYGNETPLISNISKEEIKDILNQRFNFKQLYK